MHRDFNHARNQSAQNSSIKEEKTQREVEKLMPSLKPKSAQVAMKEAWKGDKPQAITTEKIPEQKSEIKKDWAANKEARQEQAKPELKPTPTRKPPSL